MMGECYDCGLPYGGLGWIEAIIPDNAWDFISPTEDSGGLLCINCISKRLAEKGLSRIPVWFCGTEPLKAQWGEPTVAVQRTWDHKLLQRLKREREKKRKKELPAPTTPWHNGT